jgi:hypothetical protein
MIIMGKPLGSLDIPPYAIGGVVKVVADEPYGGRYGRSVGVINTGDSDAARSRVYFNDGQGGTYSELFRLDGIAPAGWPVPADVPPPGHYPLFPALLTCGHHPDQGCDCALIALEAADQD